MWKFLDAVFDRIFAVMGALIFSQAPSFIQQYIQRLAGSTHELKLQVEQIKKIADSAGLSYNEYIQKFSTSGNSLFEYQGQFLQMILDRYENFSRALYNLEQSFWLTRPFTFLKNINSDIFSGTLKHYTPAVNISLEGLIYALIGLLVGYFLYQGIRKLALELSRGIASAFKRNNQSE